MKHKKVKVLCVALVLALVCYLVTVLIFRPINSQLVIAEEFSAAWCAGDCSKIRSMMTQKAAATFDDPLLVAFSQRLKKHLGDYKGLDRKQFEIRAKVGDSSVPTLITFVLRFSKGSANVKMKLLGGKITEFFIHSKRLPKDLALLPADTTLWKDRGRQFVISYLTGNVEACYNRMNSSFQKAVPLKRFRDDADAVVKKFGKPLSIDFLHEEVDQSGKVVKFVYRVKWEKISQDVMVRFEFIGLKGSPTGFGRAISTK